MNAPDVDAVTRVWVVFVRNLPDDGHAVVIRAFSTSEAASAWVLNGGYAEFMHEGAVLYRKLLGEDGDGPMWEVATVLAVQLDR